MWGLHDGIEAEKRGRPAVTVITRAFIKAAEIRARALGLTEHPVVVIDHPIASKGEEQIQKLARYSIQEVAQGLMSSVAGDNSG